MKMKKTLTAILVLLILISVSVLAAENFQVKKVIVNSQRADFVEGEVIVKFKPGYNNKSMEAFTKGLGCTVVSTNPRGGFKTFAIPAAKSVHQMVAAYKANPNVEYAEPNYIYHLLMEPNDPYYIYQWHMPMINMNQAWDLSTGSGVIVAVIDAGVAYENYDVYALAPDLAQTTFVPGYDFINNDTHPNDDNGHGTHVAGTIAQSTNNNLGVTGVAFASSIMPVKVLDAAGSGSSTAVANGIYFAADNGAKVINMSLGSTFSSTTIEDACIYAYNKGVTIVCAAGNSGRRVLEYPAAYAQCISVSAVRLDSALAGYSTYNSEVDITAPGGDVNVDQDNDGYIDGVLQQTHDGSNFTSFSYYFYQGTSMASPHVAGVAASILALDGSLTPAEVQTILQNSAVDLGPAGWDEEYGWGLLDAFAAYQAVSPSNDPPVANFSGTPTSGDASLNVSFTDLSTNSPTSWSWTFGDGGTSTAQNPSYTYNTAGTYTVSLTATNAYGSDTNTKTDYISVTAPANDPPVADFSGSPTSGDASLNVSFTDLSTFSPTSWSWTFGDGGTSTAQNPSYTYNTAGTYTVSLTATNAYGSDTNTKTDYITVTAPSNDPPVADFSGSPTSGDASLNVSFTDLSTFSPTSWSWTFGDGGTSTAQNPSYTYNTAGTYTVALTATNAYGSDTNTKTDYITVTEPTVASMHVHDIVVTRKAAGRNCNGIGTIYIYDENEQPVANATVYATATGPVGASFSGSTGADGSVTFTTGKTRSGCEGEWCYEVTNVTHASNVYSSASNHVTNACESGWLYSEGNSNVNALKEVPDQYSLNQNYPNPFNPATEISFALPNSGFVNLSVYNVMGQKVAVLVNNNMSVGQHVVEWDASAMSSGIYLYRLETSEFSNTKKMLLIK